MRILEFSTYPREMFPERIGESSIYPCEDMHGEVVLQLSSFNADATVQLYVLQDGDDAFSRHRGHGGGRGHRHGGRRGRGIRPASKQVDLWPAASFPLAG